MWANGCVDVHNTYVLSIAEERRRSPRTHRGVRSSRLSGVNQASPPVLEGSVSPELGDTPRVAWERPVPRIPAIPRIVASLSLHGLPLAFAVAFLRLACQFRNETEHESLECVMSTGRVMTLNPLQPEGPDSWKLDRGVDAEGRHGETSRVGVEARTDVTVRQT